MINRAQVTDSGEWHKNQFMKQSQARNIMSPVSENLGFLSDPGAIPKNPNLLAFTGEVPRKVQLQEKVKLSPLLSWGQRDGRRNERAESLILTRMFTGTGENDDISSDDSLVNKTNKYSPIKCKELLSQIANKLAVDGITDAEIKNILGSDSEILNEGDLLEVKPVDSAVDNRAETEFRPEY